MSYTTGEGFIYTQVIATSGFTANNTSQGIYHILNSGKAKSYAIIRADEFTSTQTTLGSTLGAGTATYTRTWTTIIELWVNLDNYGESLAELYARRQELIEQFDKYPRLGDTGNTITDAAIVSGSTVFELTTPAGKTWLRQDLRLVWEEETNASLQE